MHLIRVDVRYFQACVFKIFEDTNWEVRYQGLDHLFGLFTKMDADFQTEWLGQLSHLGPVFSYFIGCLWDKEEYVRSKAFAMVRAFGTLHLRSAFRCWEAYFLTATDRQKMPLLSLMIRLNALFPDWQVLQWESILDALDTDDVAQTEAGSLLNAENRMAEEDEDSQKAHANNVKVLLLTLALQMLSNHTTIGIPEISRLKFALVRHMGFEDCYLSMEGEEMTVDFGPLRYNPNDATQAAIMMACSRGLKKIMDSFAPLAAEKVASMATDYLDQERVNLAENDSPGVHFIDVVLKMVSSDVDLTSLGHLTLKTWLEIVLIVVYKHDILEREYEQSVVSCIKAIIGLLTEDISEESKLLILEILKCLLRRSDHLTAMVLSKQILTLGKLMTKLGGGARTSDPVYLKAKEFLKSAFLRFAIAGLFVLMFKNQSVSDRSKNEVDLFFVLRTVIEPDDIIPDEDEGGGGSSGGQGEVIYLRDQPLRDVLDKLMKQPMDRKAFSTVLHNTSCYVERVHSHSYSEGILADYASFLHLLVKHTSDWRRSDWDINPVLTMSAILLKEHPYQHALLIPSIQHVFKHGLLHCTLQPGAVVQLMTAYSALVSIPGVQPNNVFVDMIVDELKNALSAASSRLNKDTFVLLLELVVWDATPAGSQWYTEMEATLLGEAGYRHQHSAYFENKLLHLLPSLVTYNKRPSLSKQFTKKDFKGYRCVARLIMTLCVKDPKLMLDESTECLRFLNWFILTILKEGADTLVIDLLAYEAVMIQLLTQTIKSIDIDFHAPDLGFPYSATSEKLLLWFLLIKTYTLLKLKASHLPTKKGGASSVQWNTHLFWTSLWPALRELLESIDISTLFMLTFNDTALHQHPEAIDHDISLNQFRKQVKKLLAMFTMPPVEVPAARMIHQLFLELRDAMRLLQNDSHVSEINERIV
ncbi:hypothetical protein BDF20DRAFT_928786 [Mycotypha africana]|uniref:uncharacterized protein n=1 Tax=Mycotypha africana TaxID=64632 RepID=UPI0023017C50|nr:uncharacterized protein BDF20DRAFT_928786 [Mycotypha africana]KAI8967149.1 hypothetical protein BDF20DRAFT_928786 [Mycotypha africana]